jgi:hypothetical protein
MKNLAANTPSLRIALTGASLATSAALRKDMTAGESELDT